MKHRQILMSKEALCHADIEYINEQPLIYCRREIRQLFWFDAEIIFGVAKRGGARFFWGAIQQCLQVFPPLIGEWPWHDWLWGAAGADGWQGINMYIHGEMLLVHAPHSQLQWPVKLMNIHMSNTYMHMHILLSSLCTQSYHAYAHTQVLMHMCMQMYTLAHSCTH